MHHQLIRGWLPGVGQPGNEMPPRGRLGVGSRSRGAAPDPDLERTDGQSDRTCSGCVGDRVRGGIALTASSTRVIPSSPIHSRGRMTAEDESNCGEIHPGARHSPREGARRRCQVPTPAYARAEVRRSLGPSRSCGRGAGAPIASPRSGRRTRCAAASCWRSSTWASVGRSSVWRQPHGGQPTDVRESLSHHAHSVVEFPPRRA